MHDSKTSFDRPLTLKSRADSRWYTHLRQNSTPFASLCEAQEHGWKSEVVNSWYGSRSNTNSSSNGNTGASATDTVKQTSLSSQGQQNPLPDTTKPPAVTTSTAAAHAPSISNATATSSSKAAGTVFTSENFNLDNLCDKYRLHAESIFPKGNSELFKLELGGVEAARGLSFFQPVTSVRGRGFARSTGHTNTPAAAASSSTVVNTAKVLTVTRPFTFLDLGSAPGGVSFALHRAQKRVVSLVAGECNKGADSHRDQQIGVGVSLPVSLGGIGMSSAMLTECLSSPQQQTERPPFEMVYESVADIASVIEKVQNSAVVMSAKIQHQKKQEDLIREEKDDNEAQSNGAKGKKSSFFFDFVNGGAVADFGQREATGAAPSNSSENSAACVGEGAANKEDEEKGPQLPTLRPLPPKFPVPWFELFVPQLLIALQQVKNGGDIMIVYGLSDSCSLLLFCYLMGELLSTRLPSSSSSSSSSDITFLPTMHITKPPIYVYFKGVCFPHSHSTASPPEEEAEAEESAGREGVVRYFTERLQVYDDREELSLKEQIEKGKATHLSTGSTSASISDEKEAVSEVHQFISSLNNRIGALWDRYYAMHSYWSGESDDAQREAETVWTQGVARKAGTSDSSFGFQNSGEREVNGTAASPATVDKARIPLRAQLEKMWTERADALAAKHKRIEQYASKRPRSGPSF